MGAQKKFGVRLRTLREQRSLTQKALAKKARLSQGYIIRLETGTKANPSLDVLSRLAKALKVPVADLLG
jgi:transcriptional regulator with XRE-family HTH domain